VTEGSQKNIGPRVEAPKPRRINPAKGAIGAISSATAERQCMAHPAPSPAPQGVS